MVANGVSAISPSFVSCPSTPSADECEDLDEDEPFRCKDEGRVIINSYDLIQGSMLEVGQIQAEVL